MVSDSRLEATIDKILQKTEEDVLSSLNDSLKESKETLAISQKSLEQEYDKIVDEGRKEAEKIHKQIVGSSDLESRNKQLLLVEQAIEKAFDNGHQMFRRIEIGKLNNRPIESPAKLGRGNKRLFAGRSLQYG